MWLRSKTQEERMLGLCFSYRVPFLTEGENFVTQTDLGQRSRGKVLHGFFSDVPRCLYRRIEGVFIADWVKFLHCNIIHWNGIFTDLCWHGEFIDDWEGECYNRLLRLHMYYFIDICISNSRSDLLYIRDN